MCNTEIREVLTSIGLMEDKEGFFYKDSPSRIGLNYCRFMVFNDRFLSITAGRKKPEYSTEVYERQILKILYIPSADFLLSVLKNLILLQYLFPEVVSVPNAQTVPQQV